MQREVFDIIDNNKATKTIDSVARLARPATQRVINPLPASLGLMR